MAKILEEGDYILPKGMILERAGKYITVRPTVKRIIGHRCFDCEYCISGHATANGYTTPVCKLQPKGRKDSEGYPLYFHINIRRKPCEKFKLREQTKSTL